MTSSLRKNASKICVILLMLVLFLVLIFIWTGISNDVFTQNKTTQKVQNENRIHIENRINFEPKFLPIPTNSSSDIITVTTSSELPPTTVGGNWIKERDKFEDDQGGTSPPHHQEEGTTSSSSHTPTGSVTYSSNEVLQPKITQQQSPPPPEIDQFLPDITSNDDVQLVKPIKIHGEMHPDDLLYESRKPNATVNLSRRDYEQNRHNTGHFRTKSNRIWDSHPQYEIDAFNMHMHLVLNYDNEFMKNIKVTHVWPNETIRLNDEHRDILELQGCYYKGHVRGDEKSTVAVSLCDGMHGVIRTSSGTFFIKPVERYTSEGDNILHAVYRAPKQDHNDHHRILNELDESGIETRKYSDCGVTTTDDLDIDHSENFLKPIYSSGDSVGQPLQPSPPLHSRQKRQAINAGNNEYTIEVLVAVDKKMQEYHGDAINSYVLTLMSVVSSIYADPSIGNSINVAVVHVLLLKDDFDLSDSNENGVSASAMLMKFCELKQKYSLHEHDTALLLTRAQICRNASQRKCDTLGLADVGTMCRKLSCAIVQDNGLSAAFTIAHELGHVLNMPHDDDEKCTPYQRSDREQNIMSRMLDHNTHPWSWSNCSRHYVTDFLEKDHGRCMLNKPRHDMIEPQWPNSPLAGEKFTDNKQCELVFGPQSTICSFMPVCSRLWCSQGANDSAGCKTQHMPWADGTECGLSKWCQKGYCVDRNRTALRPIDGGWGPWSPYGRCSRSCDGGVQSSTRECNSPAPTNGGKYCIGFRIRYKSCSTHNCPPGTLESREQQCRENNAKDFTSLGIERNVRWVPKYGVEPQDECKLFCRIEGSATYLPFKAKVIDGTPCRHDSFNKCVNGICRKAGCDNELDSDATIDKCGVCKGRNDSCVDQIGAFTRNQLVKNTKTPHYYDVLMIPKGASNIVLEQHGYSNDNNYIALMDDSGNYLLNGKNLINQYPHSFPYAGVTFYYTGANSTVESVTTTYAHKIQRDMYIQILSLNQGDRVRNENLFNYKYTISNHNVDVSRPTQKYKWIMSKWSDCDKLCMGSTYQTPVCTSMENYFEVSSSLCNYEPKPMDEYKTCNTDCALSWEAHKSNCSQVCGEGHKITTYTCLQTYVNEGYSNQVNNSYCLHIPQPPTQEEPCYQVCSWAYGEWEPCSHTCGSGHQNRSLTCLVDRTPVDNSFCNHIPRDYTKRLCNPEPCPEYAYGDETPCSVTCGEGISAYAIVCKQNNTIVHSSLCRNQAPIQPFRSVCNMGPCKKPIFQKKDKTGRIDFVEVAITPKAKSTNRYEWRSGRWSVCSVSCGSGGLRSRTVSCLNITSKEFVDDYYCADTVKLVTYSNCADIPCPEWNYSGWGECDHSCKRHRSVICQNRTSEVDRSLCNADTEPENSENCCHFRWRAKWTPCSAKICGEQGTRTRQRICMQLRPKSASNPHPIKKGKTVPNHYCDQLKTPPFHKATKPCRRSCEHDYRWVASPWAKCPVGCGSDYVSRNVTCTNGRFTSKTLCDASKKPSTIRNCDSTANCKWRIGKWKECNCSGIKKRRIFCWDDLTQTPSNSCPEHLRPKSRARCASPENCSCQKIRDGRRTTRDGEYVLNLRGRKVSIYCHNMTGNPREYVTLKSGSRENYSLYYSRRAKDPTTCPTTLAARQEEFDDPSIPYGQTMFHKLRILIQTLRVIEDDYTFAEVRGKAQPFGTAGDCYSKSEECPQGTFSINLENTGFRIRMRTHWQTEGLNSTIIFRDKFQSPFKRVIAQCGGYCGSCFPSKRTQLHLDLDY